MSNPLSTPWGEKLNRDEVWREYPRPQLARDSYFNLNGLWDFAITDSKETPLQYDGEILVPFSPEAALSGVNRQLMPGQYLHYRRNVRLNEEFMEERLLLNFGAVDQRCEVRVNGQSVGNHTGGYLPFTLDITDAARVGDNKLEVIVQDDTETSWHARGKQRLESGRLFYTAQSGIWQTVWMESVPQSYIQSIRITPDLDASCVHIRVLAAGRGKYPVETQILFKDQVVYQGVMTSGVQETIRLPHCHVWTPGQPQLYTVRLLMEKDRVRSYFAMRKFSTEVDDQGVDHFYLNNEPVFFLGVLDQGYWPDGLYTAPSIEAMRFDIQTMKDLGFNTIRKHIKIEPALWYYLCDTMGMMVWQDMVNGGEDYHMSFVCVFPNVFTWAGRHVKDNGRRYRTFARGKSESRREYYQDLHRTVSTLYNVPCIANWTLFNEGWGQFDASRATNMVRRMDATRLIDEASGWFDQQGGDVYSMHNYWFRLKVTPKDRVAALTECGGFGFRIADHCYSEKTFGYRSCRTKEQLTWRYIRLMQRDVMDNLDKGLCAVFYTQLSDVEEEINGLLTYDRRVLKPVEESIKKTNRQVMKKFKALQSPS